MTVFQFLLAGLACYRLTVLFSRDAGPFDVFKLLRKHSKLVACPYCVSVWLGGFVEAAFYFSGIVDPWVVMLSIVLALSAVAIILDRIFTSDHLT